jgi:ADP-heptose:LPS heptosyltransferase
VSAGRHVLVARLDNAGDVLLSGPAVRACAARARTLTYLAGPSGAAAARLLPGVDDVIVFDAPWCGYEPPDCDTAAVDRLVARVRAAAVDDALILTSWHQSPLPLALLLRMAGVGRVAAISADYPGSLLDVRAPEPGDVHEVERAYGLAVLADYADAGSDPGPLAVRGVRGVVPTAGDRYVVVHPGASVAARSIGVDRAVAAVDALHARGWNIVVTGGPDEVALARSVASRARADVRVVAPGRDLRALAGLLAGAAACVCGNTGPAHLAAAVGTPVVAVFAPVVPPARWRPWRVPHVLLGDHDIECAGCRARVCPIPGQPCLRAVDGGAIAAAVASVARGARDVQERQPAGCDDVRHCEVNA